MMEFKEWPVVVPKLEQDKRNKNLFVMGPSRVATSSDYFCSSVCETKKFKKYRYS
jgi:hypothetical protein